MVRNFFTKEGFTAKVIVSAAALAALLLPSVASAATLSVSPSSGSYAVGRTFSVSIGVSSVDQAMNAASGVLSFPANKLEVVSISKTGSIFSLWVQEPSFSNTAGTVSFAGIVLNPGFTGTYGRILSVSFRAKATGSATLSFSSTSVLANDGNGTNILTKTSGATFTIVAATPPPPAPAPQPAPAPAPPPAPSGPAVKGFDIRPVPREDPTDPHVAFIFSTTPVDAVVDHYEIQIDSGAKIIWIDDGTHAYLTPAMSAGRHVIVVNAIDKAGNGFAASAGFAVQSIQLPVFTAYPRELRAGEPLVIEGTTYPGAQVRLWLQKGDEAPTEHAVLADAVGVFAFTDNEAFSAGTYYVWAQVTDSRGATSAPTDKIAIRVVQPSLLQDVLSWMAKPMPFGFGLLFIVIVLLQLIILWRMRRNGSSKRVKA